MNVRVTRHAQAQVDRAARWWDENRDLAPEAFDEDLAEAFLLLSAEPGVGLPVLRTRAQGQVQEIEPGPFNVDSFGGCSREERACSVFIAGTF